MGNVDICLPFCLVRLFIPHMLPTLCSFRPDTISACLFVVVFCKNACFRRQSFFPRGNNSYHSLALFLTWRRISVVSINLCLPLPRTSALRILSRTIYTTQREAGNPHAVAAKHGQGPGPGTALFH